MTESTNPAPPSGLGDRGTAYWNAVVSEFDLEPQDLAILESAARTVDRIAALDEVVDRDGVMSTSSQGIRTHPALQESRQQRLTLVKLVAALKIPAPDDL